MNSLFNVTVAVLVVFLVSGCQTPNSRGWAFYPVDQKELKSPDGAYAIVNEGTFSQNERSLFLVENNTGEKRELLKYVRNIAVRWSPSGRTLLVNDYDGSDHATCRLYFVDRPAQIDLEEVLLKSPYGHLGENDHFYLEGVKWLGESRVAIEVYGHGEKDGEFSQKFIYDIGNGEFINMLRESNVVSEAPKD